MMAKNRDRSFPEVFLSTKDLSSRVSRAVAKNKARKLGPRLYTTNMSDPEAVIVRRNLWPIVGLLCPNAVVGHRTALEGRPTPDGSVFLTGPYSRTLELPGLTIRMVKGPGPLPGDAQFVGGVWHASQARAFLENLKPSRRRSAAARSIPREQLEERVERILQASGPDALNALRDQASRIAPALDADAEYRRLSEIVGTLLGTRSGALAAPIARARAAGVPYDPARIEVFQTLLAQLRQWQPISRPASGDADVLRNLAFFDAFFSNYIEGTEFTVKEAAQIVFENRVPTHRPEDAHDVLGTFRILSRTDVMSRSAIEYAHDPKEFLAVLRQLHSELLSQRLDKRPGQFKVEPNRAGNTVFVDPDLVVGTLVMGLEFYRSLATPFAQAAFMMFLLTEVHPFDDGNGRLARIMMNIELHAGGETRVIIPTVYREDYFGALRVLTRQSHALPFVQMLDYAQRFTAAVDFRDLSGALALMRDCNAFEDTGHLRLRLPESAT